MDLWPVVVGFTCKWSPTTIGRRPQTSLGFRQKRSFDLKPNTIVGDVSRSSQYSNAALLSEAKYTRLRLKLRKSNYPPSAFLGIFDFADTFHVPFHRPLLPCFFLSLDLKKEWELKQKQIFGRVVMWRL